MSLLKKIDIDIKFAMKSKDALSLESLRAVKSSILLFKTKSGSSIDLTAVSYTHLTLPTNREV